MSIPNEEVRKLLESLSSRRIESVIAQTDARRILQEVMETVENFPDFEPDLSEKSVHIAYTLISCGCSIIENNKEQTDQIDINQGLETLEKAGKLLSDIFQYNLMEDEQKNYNLLISGMALYASKQYSRAFIVLKNIDIDFTVGQIISTFIKKDFDSLLQMVNNMLVSEVPEQFEILELDEWIMSREIARCFYIILDYINTGNSEGFVLIDEILDKLLQIASEDNLTLYWMIIRLLKILLYTFKSASLWTNLTPLLPVERITKKYIRLLSKFKSPVVEIWPSQLAAIPLALDNNKGAVINLRTSGGKTRVAEISILKTLTVNLQAKVLYLAPFRSLAFEIEQSLNKTFRPLGITVSQLYGGSTVNITDFDLIEQSQIIIATPEKAKALIRSGSGIESEIKLIVIDEGHLLGAEERYIRSEIFITHINEFAYRNDIRVLLLSAVLPNADDLAQWIAGDRELVAKSEWKPSLERKGLLLWNGYRVRLEWNNNGIPFNPNFVVKAPLGFGFRRNPFPNNKNEAVAATAVRLSENGTVMIFSARAKSIEGLAKCTLLALGENPDDYSWDPMLWKIFKNVCDEELPVDNILVKAAQKGVICHNNKLPSHVRIAIERLMRSKPPLIIIASSTLGQGVNVGISTVIVSTPYYSNESISNRDFWNICGRAGRAFTDNEGKILYAIDLTEEDWKIRKNKKLAKDYFDNSKMERAESGLLIALKYIYKYAESLKIDYGLLIETIANDFLEFEENSELLHLKEIFDLFDDELIAMNENFGSEDSSFDWIDDLFRNSLALIQANEDDKNKCLGILKARTQALLIRINSKDRKKLVATGVPLSVSQKILVDKDIFKNLSDIYYQGILNGENKINLLNKLLRDVESWSNQNASTLMKQVPSQEILEQMREDWLKGISLVIISQNGVDADDIVKDYYGFTLPWIIHAISQMFDSKQETKEFQFYSNLATFVELGLPDEVAANIYMAGVRSRSAALEISTLEELRGKSINEVKTILLGISVGESRLTEISKVWIEMLADLNNRQKRKTISFPIFTWKRKGLPKKLYLHEVNDKYYLASKDGYFMEQVESTKELPFSNISKITGLYFENNNDDWILKSYNPLVAVDVSKE